MKKIYSTLAALLCVSCLFAQSPVSKIVIPSANLTFYVNGYGPTIIANDTLSSDTSGYYSNDSTSNSTNTTVISNDITTNSDSTNSNQNDSTTSIVISPSNDQSDGTTTTVISTNNDSNDSTSNIDSMSTYVISADRIIIGFHTNSDPIPNEMTKPGPHQSAPGRAIVTGTGDGSWYIKCIGLDGQCFITWPRIDMPKLSYFPQDNTMIISQIRAIQPTENGAIVATFGGVTHTVDMSTQAPVISGRHPMFVPGLSSGAAWVPGGATFRIICSVCPTVYCFIAWQ